MPSYLKKYINAFLFCWIFLCPLLAKAQGSTQENAINEIEKLWEEYLEYHTEEEASDLFESFSDLIENPISLNHAQKEDLDRLPFLSALQKEQLAYYLYKHSHISHLSELLLIEGWDEWCLQRVRPFVILGNPLPDKESFSWKNIKTEILGQTATQLQSKQGYKNQSDSLIAASKAYMGNAFHSSFQLTQTIDKKLQWGITAEKDAGEKGIDYFSWHILWHGIKVINDLIIGDYKVSLGQGLILSAGFFGGKSSASGASLGKSSHIRRHFSTAESGFMRGLAAEIDLPGHWQGTAFVSHKKIDTNRHDSLFTSVSSIGYHRTLQEEERKKNTLLQQVGGQISYQKPYWHIGLNALYYRYDAVYCPEWQAYNALYTRQNSGGNVSIHYRRLWQGILFSGESAVDTQGHSAHIGNISFRWHPLIDCFLSARYYDPRYQAPFASAFSEGSGVRNECGIYFSSEWRIWKHLCLTGYVDYFCFPWLKYGVHAPSQGYDWMIEIQYRPNDLWEGSLRYKEKSTEKNFSGEGLQGIYPCRNGTKHQWRGQYRMTYRDWRFKSLAETNLYRHPSGSTNYGSALSQEIRYAPSHRNWWVVGQYSLFDTESYENSIYFYEQDLPKTFSMPSLYGHGMRCSLLWGCRLGKYGKLYLKWRHTRYTDRENIGSGLDESIGNRCTLFSCQWKGTF